MSGKVQRIITLKEKCIIIDGARIFNSLPHILRNFNGEFKDFKNLFDCYMKEVPDCPIVPGYVSHNLDIHNHMSNSLIDWNRNLSNSDWQPERDTKMMDYT